MAISLPADYVLTGLDTIDVTGVPAGKVFSVFVATPGHHDGSSWPIATYSDVANPDPNIVKRAYIDDGGTTNIQGYLFTWISDGVATTLHFEPLFETGVIEALGYSGVDTTSPYDTCSGAAGSSGTASAPSITTANAGEVLSWFGNVGEPIGSPTDGTNTYATEIDGSTVQLQFRNVGAYDRIQSAAGSSGAVSSTLGGSADWIVGLIALNPAAGGGGGGGPVTDQVPLDISAVQSAPRPAGLARAALGVIAPVGALLATALSSVAWASAMPLPARSQPANLSTLQPSQPIGVGKFALSKQGWSGPAQINATPRRVDRPQPSQPTGPLKPFVSASVGWLRADLPIDLPLIPRSVSESSPIGSIIGAALSPLGWNMCDAPPRRTLTAIIHQPSGAEGPLKPFVSASSGFGLYVSIPFDLPLIWRQPSSDIGPVGSLIIGGLPSLGWLGVDALSPTLTAPRAQEAVAPSGPLSPFLSPSTGFFGLNSVSPVVTGPRAQEVQQPAGPLRPFVSASSGFQTTDTKSTAALGPRAQDAVQPPNALTPFISASTGWLTADIPVDLPLIPRTVSEISPVGSLLPGSLTSLGWLGADSVRSVLAPRSAQDATQPTGPLAPFVSPSNGWDAPLAARQSVFSFRPEASAPVGSLIRPLISLGWIGPDTRTPILPAPRAQEPQQPAGPLKPFVSPTLGWMTAELILDQPVIPRQVSGSSPTGILLTPQPFGWGSSLEQARPAPVIPRRVEASAPVGTAFAIALPSNGWLATDNPRTPLTLGKSVPQDPVGNLLVSPPLSNLTWLATENPRTPYTTKRAVVVDPVGSSLPLPGQHGPFWFIDQSRATPPRALAATPSEPVGTLFATLTSIGWLSPFEAPHAPASAQRPQPSDPLRALQFGGAPWSTVDVRPGQGSVARSPETSQPAGPLAPFPSLSLGWLAPDAQRPSIPIRSVGISASAPVGTLLQSALTSIGWANTDQFRPRGFTGAPVGSSQPVGALLTQGLTSIGWYWSDAAARPALTSSRQQESASPVSALKPFVSLSSGWQVFESQRSRAPVAQPPQLAQSHLHSALAFAGAPWAGSEIPQRAGRSALGLEGVTPIGVAFSQQLSSLGWFDCQAFPPRFVSARVATSSPDGQMLPAIVLPSMGWQSHVDLPPKWIFIARPVPSEPVGSSFALAFHVAPFGRCSPVFDLNGAGRMSPVFDVSGTGRVSPIFREFP